MSALGLFHPLIRAWFSESVGTPTDIQQRAWPEIAAGEHVLITAPTGSGKTLTAFLWAIDRLLTSTWQDGGVRVLYISPLRALNNDIRRNLDAPLAALEARFDAAGTPRPAVRVMTRSGDTSPSERRKMLRHPPEILITTPESLNVLLTSRSGRRLLTGLESVILDEVHAVAASKRGTHLITAVDRLVPLSGDFQRIALSATVRPLETMARFVGGYVRESEGVYRPRPVRIVRSQQSKAYDLKVRFPLADRPDEDADEDELWRGLVNDFKKVIRSHRSTLFFANSRRLVEKVTRFINAEELDDLAYSHHGSLSREVRAVVEERLKKGELGAIVATNSLELGIDIGALDEVVMIQTPRSIASAIQRIGRSGHGVGQVSRGRLYPTHGRDFVEAAVVAHQVMAQEIEEIRPIELALDVLAQVILSIIANEEWTLDDLFALLRTSYPFHRLSERHFHRVLEMLSGRYADSRIRELRPRVRVDRVAGTVVARKGVERLIYMSGGTIPDRGYFALRREDSMARLGELDEEFVWERSIGDTFTLGTQSWQIRKITHNEVLVMPGRGGSALAPFWRADAVDRGAFLSEKVGEFLERAQGWLAERRDADFRSQLEADYCLESGAVQGLLDHLREQRAATGSELPHRHHLLVERVHDSRDRTGKQQMILHTLWGGTVNRPLALALQAAYEERYKDPLDVAHDDDCLLVRMDHPLGVHELLALVDPERIENLLRAKLENSGFFGARFRMNASTALLLPRAGFQQRTPLWLTRQRAKKLGEAITVYGDFPILIETWRTCLEDEFELEVLRQRLGEVASGEIRVSEAVTSSPSPFAAGLMWNQTNFLMYEDDSPESSRTSQLRHNLLQDVVFSSRLRPRLPTTLVERFVDKIQRTAPGYAPTAVPEILDWLDERVLLPSEEWQSLLAAAIRDADGALDADGVLEELASRVARLRWPGEDGSVVLTLERWVQLARSRGLALEEWTLEGLASPEFPGTAADRLRRLAELEGHEGEDGPADLASLVAEWLRFCGPVSPSRVPSLFGLDEATWRGVVSSLQDDQRLVIDTLRRESEALELCDSENLEILLRWLRIASRPSFEPLPASHLSLFVAHQQGLTHRGDCLEDLQARLETLFGYPLPAAAWEQDVLPARLEPYYPSWLDSLIQQSDLRWFGCGQGRLSFAFESDLELFSEPPEGGDATEPDASGEDLPDALFPTLTGRYSLPDLARHGDRPSGELSEELWRRAWDGEVTNDSFAVVRKGIETKFQPFTPKPTAGRRPSRRRPSHRSANRWQASRAFLGHWHLLPRLAGDLDALDREELIKDRVRLLLTRYGLLFRERLQRELPSLRWAQVFRTLRLMELSGEVLAGQFFHGISGLQFISQPAWRRLQEGLPADAIYWMNAADPASLCGVDIEGLKKELPARRASTQMVFHGHRLVLIARSSGRRLTIRVSEDDPHFDEYVAVLKHLLTRDFQPKSHLAVEEINGEPAAKSPFVAPLARHFRVTRESPGIKLWREYGAG